ncbi:MAG: osmotic-shock protein [Proteobacteria bacterium]|nr:osmotic-shock protein [Pseudomonadota bacterium]RPJ45446.1 MAG: YggT family protein [Betaproteobacteria bacterium]
MLGNALIFIAQVAFGLLTLTLLLRFYLQWVRAPYRNPLADFINALTDFMVRPARRFIPGLWGLDLPTLLLAWFLQVLELLVVLQVRGYRFGAEVGLAAIGIASLAAMAIVKMLIYIVMVATLLQALLSWINPGSPVAPLLDAMTRPLLRLFRRHIPPVGNVDLSPLLLIVVCQLLLILPLAWLESEALQML